MMFMKTRVFSRPSSIAAFTLIELLVVISIIALLAGLAVPVIHNLKPNVVAGATRQFLDDIHRARQLAISQRTTVYMVFVPTNFWNLPGMPPASDLVSKTNALRLLDKQLVAYNFVSLHSVGDQPGKTTTRYLSSWKTLPEGVYISPEKFLPRSVNPTLTIFTNDVVNGPKKVAYKIYGFNTVTNIPFPAEDTPRQPSAKNPYISLPYIAFNYLGQLTSGQNELIPLAQGAVLFRRDPTTGDGMQVVPAVRESPIGNVTNAYNVVSIDWLTGRAHLERQQVQ
jgi:prepilin-type N-terminal cleavage/methylation domain-containing protein